MSTTIKTTAIPAAGYVYQTMQGVNLLCDWLDSPSRYTRIRFECDVDAVAPRGLDDLVAERPDGRIDLWQVKFTPSPATHTLDWDWLLDKPGKAGGKSRSNLRKWFDAFGAIELARLGDVRLLTNRVPDLVMEACLAGSRLIDYTRAPDGIRAKVEQELDGAANALRFFKALEINHSDKGFAGMEAYVTQRLRRRASAEGVETLKNRAIHWSIEKNQPAPDGWITLDLLKTTLRVLAPEPLPENFVIPPDYRVPDNTFFLSFISTIEVSPRQPIVLTGPPGRGKSTFLSKVCERLQETGIPLVRHHYYLSSTDRTLDRHTSFVVEESLLAQIKNFHDEVAIPDQTLHAALSACAAHYHAQGKPFVVILDGLDHVWRNQGHDKRPLDEIFNQLLPMVENLVVVVGTQPVDDAQLPNRLLVEAPRKTWRELPTMSGDAVLHYLRKALKQGRLHMEHHRATAEEELQSTAAELRVRTNGHPLHVIYATEELVRSGRALSKWSVEQLAGDLSHDAKHYYGSLWQLLNASQKDVLRLIAELPFFWPQSAFASIANLAGLPAPAVVAVEHLLHHSAAGLKPFHESLVVFIRQTDIYEKRVAALIPHVETWLGTSAPNALRVNWLWAVKAKQGHPDELIAGIQRDWVMQRLQEGYPTALFESLLGDAEEHAVQRARYADAYRLRHLKTRLLNSLSYQLSGPDAARLKACTWALAPDASVIDEAFASRHETSIEDVAALGLALSMRGDLLNATQCGEEALQRHRGESRFSSRHQGHEAHGHILYLVKVFSALGVIGNTPERAVEMVDKQWPAIARKLLEAHVEKGSLRTLVGIAATLPNGVAKVLVCDAAVRAAILLGADLPAWSEFPQLSCGVLMGCSAALAGNATDVWTGPLELNWLDGGYEERQASLASLAHDWLFGAVRFALTTKEEDFCLLEAPKFRNRENVSGYLNHLGGLCHEVARRWLAQESVSFSYIYEAFNGIHFPDYRNYEVGKGASDFRRTLHAIATDLHLLSSQIGQAPIIDVDEFRRAMSLSWFDANQFRAQYVSGLAKVLSDSAAEHFIRTQLEMLDANVNEETGVRMIACLELCEMALRHGLKPLAADLCRRTWELALGYGQRKDPALSDVMDALEYLASIAPDDTRRVLAEIAPQVHHILAYTDGKGTRHVLAQADELLARLHRGALVEKHREHAELGDWRHAENSLESFVVTGDAESPLLNAVMRTGLHTEAIDALRKLAMEGDSNAEHLHIQAKNQMGADVGQIRESQGSNSEIDSKPFIGDVKTYAVSDLPRLLSDLTGHYMARQNVLRNWYCHWEELGEGSALIATMEQKLLSESCRDDGLYELLDLAFMTKLRLEGAAAAFPYIVQEQRMHGGWSGPMMERREVTEERLRRLVEKYPRRCDEFFLKSAFTWYAEPRLTRVIPSDLMVFFLALQGRTAEAVQFAEAMIRSVQEDTRTLHLESPNWARTLSETIRDTNSNTNLELLIARLRWPVAATRWWAMQELAALLRSSDTQGEILKRLLSELTCSRLEAEGVEILCIFWMATQQGYQAPPDLGAAVTHPCMLSALLLSDMKLSLPGRPNPPLELASEDFVVPARFRELQNLGVPRIYYTRLVQLERSTGLPFLKQCAFEWARTEGAYSEAPLQGDLSYFVRPLGEGATGCFASRALLRMTTAYQRTLDVARSLWNLPEKTVWPLIAEALFPIDPTLALLSSARPSWLPHLGKHIADVESTELFIRRTLDNLATSQPNTLLLSLVSPTYVDNQEIVELTVVRWRQWGRTAVEPQDLAARFFSRQEKGDYGACQTPVWGATTFVPVAALEHVLDQETNAAPMAAVYSFNRMGYLQKDLYPSRLYYPVVTGSGGKLEIEPMGSELNISAAHKRVGTIHYWNTGWSPAHPAVMSGLCGTALLGASHSHQREEEPAPDRYFYLWKLTRMRRSYSYEPFTAESIYGVITL